MTKNDESRLADAKAKYPDAGRTLLAQMTGLTPHQVRGWLDKTGLANKPVRSLHELTRNVDLKDMKGIKVGEFLHKLDFPKVIRDTIKQHCDDAFHPEHEFRRLTGLSQADFNLGKDTGTFHENIFKIDNVLYWSTTKNVAQAKKIRGT